MNPVDKIERRGLRAEIIPDDEPMNPRIDCHNLGKMVCFHGRHNLGDKHDLKSGQFNGWGEVKKHLEKEEGAIVVLPLFLFDHSGLTISTRKTAFEAVDHMGWDWGLLGFIYAAEKAVRDEYSLKGLVPIPQKTLDQVQKVLEQEIEIYDQYLRGDVYSVVVTKADVCDHGDDHREVVDSCCGFFGLEYAQAEAGRMLDAAAKQG